MKKFILLIVLCVVSFFYFKTLRADLSTYQLYFNPNTEADMDHYNLFVWQGTDTLLCPFQPGMVIDQASPFFRQQIPYTASLNQVPFTAESDGFNYISVALQAVDTRGNHSTAAVAVTLDGSRFLLTEDRTSPDQPQNLLIGTN